MKKILVVTEVFYPENFIINDLVKEWQDRGVSVDILTQWPSYPYGKVYDGYSNEKYGEEKWGTSTIYRYKFIEGYKDSILKKIHNYIKFVKEGKNIIDRIGKNYDHVFVSQTGPITVGLPAVYLKKKYGIPYTIWVFDLWPETFFEYGFPRVQPLIFAINKLVKKLLSNAENILVSSKQFEDCVKKFTSNTRIEYAPNWLIKYTCTPSSIKINSSKFNFTFTGNIGMSVNLLSAVKGFELANIENSIFNIVGDGSCLGEIKEYILEKNINNVILHGRVPQNEVDDILNKSDVLVLSLIPTPGIMKVEPFKIQSYLKAKKPIYGVTKGAGKDLIEENNLGLCSNPNDIKDIALKFSNMISYSDNNKDLIANSAEELIKNRFNREKVIEKINSIVL